jgi:hypothetical protein
MRKLFQLENLKNGKYNLKDLGGHERMLKPKSLNMNTTWKLEKYLFKKKPNTPGIRAIKYNW